MIVNLIVAALKGFLMSFVTEAIFKRVFFEVAEEFTEWTDTDADDAILRMARNNNQKITKAEQEEF